MQPIKPTIKTIPYQNPVHYLNCLSDHAGCVFLDSSMQHPELGRYSFIAIDPFKSLARTQINHKLNFFDELKNAMALFKMTNHPQLPPFQGGCAGFFSYDLARELENLPNNTVDDINYPLAGIGFFDVVISFDHITKKAWLCSSGFPETHEPARQQRANNRLNHFYNLLTQETKIPIHANFNIKPHTIKPDITVHQYKKAVTKIIQYILEGDIFEANFTQRFCCDLAPNLTAWQLYQQLRTINPATFSAYINMAGIQIASSSPERFLQVNNQSVQTRPIKGTRPRVDDPILNQQYIDELLVSRKDHAENTMIVDLMRNDLSKVCKPHSIKVPQLCGLESYAKVHHLVSVVTGELQATQQAIDLLKVCFPGGSITGAPKVRAMEIIEELEPTKRGPYCGSIGYIGFNGCMDTSIVIRTMLIKDRQVTFQAGGAIVLDSNPQEEYDESLAKANALQRTLTQLVTEIT